DVLEHVEEPAEDGLCSGVDFLRRVRGQQRRRGLTHSHAILLSCLEKEAMVGVGHVGFSTSQLLQDLLNVRWVRKVNRHRIRSVIECQVPNTVLAHFEHRLEEGLTDSSCPRPLPGANLLPVLGTWYRDVLELAHVDQPGSLAAEPLRDSPDGAFHEQAM